MCLLYSGLGCQSSKEAPNGCGRRSRDPRSQSLRGAHCVTPLSFKEYESYYFDFVISHIYMYICIRMYMLYIFISYISFFYIIIYIIEF